MNKIIKLPCLRGRMGDWIYYVSLMNFKEIANRISMATEIHKNRELSRWIQREVSDRSEDIVLYLKEQPQRFFNSIICGIYGGKPQWQELDIDENSSKLNEIEKEYLGRTFGILTLAGDEKIFAIDGQHRTNAIKKYLSKNVDLNEEEVTVIIVAHKSTPEGEVRTRRLFSTLNRYAVPVNISEIIALDEEDNCAILTRMLMENFDYFSNKFQFSKTRNISKANKNHFSNIVLLYDMISIVVTDKSFSKNIKFQGYEIKKFSTRREKEEVLNLEYENLKTYFLKVFNTIPSIKNFFREGVIDRKLDSTSLIFRPIGQIVLFYVLKIAKANNKERQALLYFKKDSLNLNNTVWNRIFIDPESQTLKTDKPRQILAIQLICKKIGINIPMTTSEKSFMLNFQLDINLL
jgi:DNA sulfur modification protein DndB